MTLNALQIKNDEFRKNLIQNHQNNKMSVFFAPNLSEYYETNPEVFYEVLRTVINLKESDFTEDNDPHKEHDFAFVDVAGEKFFFKIDYYDAHYEGFCGEENLLDDEKCNRVLTIGHSSDY